jgi:hypothetical protein
MEKKTIGKIGRMSKEEFNKLPKQEQEKILKQRDENRKEREAELKKVATLDYTLEGEQTDRQKSALFNSIYATGRKAFVVLSAKKKTGVSIDEVLAETREMLVTLSEKI